MPEGTDQTQQASNALLDIEGKYRLAIDYALNLMLTLGRHASSYSIRVTRNFSPRFL